ncbi:hypothetical protein L596_030358 [Steinernema carpocapsae]|uniref:Uncharacterized protein n=1 Tax=Steinernema carpocapsae TaxID=34508 RepID=A0A4U5LP53_STECR|nr:hypothetical protein L596_030358 [Steinernema carpocapsae]
MLTHQKFKEIAYAKFLHTQPLPRRQLLQMTAADWTFLSRHNVAITSLPCEQSIESFGHGKCFCSHFLLVCHQTQ